METSVQRPVVLARGEGVGGEVALRRRGEVLELIVAGVFAMDSAHTGTERALARLALEHLGSDAAGVRVVIGGLGLGFTLGTVLAERAVARVRVVELEPLLPRWAADGLLGEVGEWLADPRVRVEVGDVHEVVAGLPTGGTDLILLDVDNGPGFLVHPGNAALYRRPFLAVAAAALRPGGVLAIWSADPAPTLSGKLRRVLGECTEVELPVQRDGREFTYLIYLARRGSTWHDAAAGTERSSSGPGPGPGARPREEVRPGTDQLDGIDRLDVDHTDRGGPGVPPAHVTAGGQDRAQALDHGRGDDLSGHEHGHPRRVGNDRLGGDPTRRSP